MNFIIAAVFDNYVNAHMALGRLQDENINCWLKDENTITVLTNSGGIKLMVAEPRIERALALLHQEKQPEVQNPVCPRCGSENIETVNDPRREGSLIGTIASLVLNAAAASPANHISHCFDCGYETK